MIIKQLTVGHIAVFCYLIGCEQTRTALAVDPAERRKGYARQLVAAAENALQESGIAVIAVLIERENSESLAFFQDLGYQRHDDICYLSKRDSAEA